MKNRTKEIQSNLLEAENSIVRGATLYCSKHNIEFTRSQQNILRISMRKFFKDHVAPNMRDIYEDNVKVYPSDKKT